MDREEMKLLRELARYHGIQPAYIDVGGRRREASPGTLKALLQALGTVVSGRDDLQAALRKSRQVYWEQCLEPVTVVSEQKPGWVKVRLRQDRTIEPLSCRLRMEDGSVRTWSSQPERLPRTRSGVIEGAVYGACHFALPGLPRGYHELEIQRPDKAQGRTWIICAPPECYAEEGEVRGWGLFLPMYAVHSQRSWGAGDLTDWSRFSQWVGSLGGGMVGTLPILAAFLDRPYEPSPYSPVSRLFWNEFYIDVETVPEFSACPAGRKLALSPGFQRQLQAFRKNPLVDYRAEMSLKRRVLARLAQYFFAGESPRRGKFQEFLKQRPEAENYARFRAVGEQTQRPWRQWPERLRDGELCPGDYDPAHRDYHLYVQWIVETQLEEVLASSGARGVQLCLDLPVGVHPDGYDMWQEQRSFLRGVSVGAPPDLFFRQGQNWGFAPLHPQAMQETHYEYVLNALRFQMRHAGLLRIDHVMGLHRLYLIPEGLPASDGAYLSYSSAEMYALLCLESHRHQTMLAGENLGTVPPEVNRAMQKHGLRQMYVAQYEARPRGKAVLRPVPARATACLNTHDMPTFGAWCTGLDIDQRSQLGLLPRAAVDQERRRRRAMLKRLAAFLRARGYYHGPAVRPGSLLKSALGFLGSSRAEMLLVNLEDLWLESRPQNVPGSSCERPNWRQKTRFMLEDFSRKLEVLEPLQEIARVRHPKKFRWR